MEKYVIDRDTLLIQSLAYERWRSSPYLCERLLRQHLVRQIIKLLDWIIFTASYSNENTYWVVDEVELLELQAANQLLFILRVPCFLCYFSREHSPLLTNQLLHGSLRGLRSLKELLQVLFIMI